MEIYISGAEGVMNIYIIYLYLYCYSISFFPPFNYVIPDSNGGKFSSSPFILGAVFFPLLLLLILSLCVGFCF